MFARITPLTDYRLPRYGWASLESLRGWAAWLVRRGAGRLAALLLVAGLGLGGCSEQAEVLFTGTDGDSGEAEAGDGQEHEAIHGEDGDGERCREGAYYGCVEVGGAGQVRVCEDGRMTLLGCAVYCRENGYGPEPDPAGSCAPAESELLCQCGGPDTYADGDGVDTWCSEDNLTCTGTGSQVESCKDNQRIVESCEAYCARREGSDTTSKGCDNTLPSAERCQCAKDPGGDPDGAKL